MKRAYWITIADITLVHKNEEEVYSTDIPDCFTLYDVIKDIKSLYPHAVIVKIEHRHRFVHESDNYHGRVNNPLFDENFDFTW